MEKTQPLLCDCASRISTSAIRAGRRAELGPTRRAGVGLSILDSGSPPARLLMYCLAAGAVPRVDQDFRPGKKTLRSKDYYTTIRCASLVRDPFIPGMGVTRHSGPGKAEDRRRKPARDSDSHTGHSRIRWHDFVRQVHDRRREEDEMPANETYYC